MAIYDQVDQLIIGAAGGVIRIMPVDPSSGAAVLGLAPADVFVLLTPAGGTKTLVATQPPGGGSLGGGSPTALNWGEVPTMTSGGISGTGTTIDSFYTLGFQPGTYAYYSLVAGPMMVSVFRVSDLAKIAEGEVIVMAATDADLLAANATAVAAVTADAALAAADASDLLAAAANAARVATANAAANAAAVAAVTAGVVAVATDVAAVATGVAAAAAGVAAVALYVGGRFKIDPTSGVWTLYGGVDGTTVAATGTMYTSADGSAWTPSATNILQRCQSGQDPTA